MYRSISQLNRQVRVQKIAWLTFVVFMALVISLVFRTQKNLQKVQPNANNSSVAIS